MERKRNVNVGAALAIAVFILVVASGVLTSSAVESKVIMIILGIIDIAIVLAARSIGVRK